MANWFGTSTGLFKGRAPDTPQPFEIECECGQRHTGMRRQQHQRIICRACGAALFILPKDVYPASADSIPPTSAKPWSESVEDAALVEIEDPEAEAASKRRKTPVKAERQQASRKVSDPPKSQPAAPQTLPAPQPDRAKKAKPQGPFWTPLRMVAIAMVAIVVLTLFAMLRAQRLEDARRQLAASVEQFNTAVSERDWARARSQINLVVESLDILGRDDASARRHRQFHREIAAMNDLARSSLFEILEESDANHARDPADWKTTFTSQHAGYWLVLELPARRGERIETPDGDRNMRPSDDDESSVPRYHYEFEFPISVGPNARSVEIALSTPALDLLAWGEQGRSVVVAAELSDLELSADRSRWIVTFDPETTFLWGNIETYEGLGFTFNEWNPRELMQTLLDEQAVALGISKTPSAASPAGTELASREGSHE